MGRVVLVVVALIIAGCGPAATDSGTTTAADVPVTEVSVTTSTLDDGAVNVTVSGWVHEDRRGLVVCPTELLEACAGIPLDGAPTGVDAGDAVAVTGSYDGVSLTVERVEVWTPFEGVDLASPCTGETERGNLHPSRESQVYDVIRGHEDRVAGHWLAGGQAVIGLVGPGDDLADDLRALGDWVCVDTGYVMSQRDRSVLAGEIRASLLAEDDVWILREWVDASDGPIRFRAEQIDTATRTAIDAEYRDAPFELTSYIEVLDAPLADLPDQRPPVPADLDIPTAATRVGFSDLMNWGSVVLRFDAEARCLYVGERGDRLVVVWPFGYSAVSGEPTIVYDPAGNEVARTGVPTDLGGGSADIEVVEPAQRCGAQRVLQMAGPTERQRDGVGGGRTLDE